MSYNFQLEELVKKGTLDEVKAYLEKEKQPTKILTRVCDSANYRERENNERTGIPEFLMMTAMKNRKLSGSYKGCDAAFAAHSGSIEMMKLAKSRKVSLSEPSSYGTPLFIAIFRNDLEMIKYLVEEGVDPDLTTPYRGSVMAGMPFIHTNNTVAKAILNSTDEVVDYLMDNGAGCNPYALNAAIQKGDKKRVEQIVKSGVKIEDGHLVTLKHTEMIDVLLNLGWDGRPPKINSKDPYLNIWYYWNKAKDVTFVEKMVELGVPFKVLDLANHFSRLPLDKWKQLFALLAKPQEKFKISEINKKGTLMDWAFVESTMDKVEFLVTQNFPPLMKLRIEDDWDEAEEKQVWLDNLLGASSISIEEYLKLKNPTKREIKQVFSAFEKGLFNIFPGMKIEELDALNLPFKKRTKNYYQMSGLVVYHSGGKVNEIIWTKTSIDYVVGAFFKELLESKFKKKYGNWQTPFGSISLTERNNHDANFYEATLTLVRKNEKEQGSFAKDLEKLCKHLKESINDIAADVFESNVTIEKVIGKQVKEGVEFSVILNNSDNCPSLIWEKPNMDKHGLPTDELEEAIISAIGSEVMEY